MNESKTQDATQDGQGHRTAALSGIASFKLGKGLFFFLVAWAVYCLSDDDLHEAFSIVLLTFHQDPKLHAFDGTFKWLSTITESNMLWVAGGILSYALLAMVEGVGLFLRYYWAAYLAIAESAIFIPMEIVKLMNHFTWLMLGLLLLNIFILIYLWINRHRLFRHTHYHDRHKAKPPVST
ncbi:MAG: DUF2127 domain-containing protein [Verrucomicrobiota bacterium]